MRSERDPPHPESSLSLPRLSTSSPLRARDMPLAPNGAGNARQPPRGRTLLPHLGLYSWPKAMPYNNHRRSRGLPRRQLGYKFGHFHGCPARAGRPDLARVSRLQMPSCRTRNTLTRAGLTLTDRIQLCGSFRSLPTPALSIVTEIFLCPGRRSDSLAPDLGLGLRT